MKNQTLELRLKAFRLPLFLANYVDLAQKAQKGGWGHLQYLESLAELEAEDRRNRRVQRLLIEARIPRDKTLSVLDLDRFSPAVRSQARALGEGQFLSSSTNVCVFGNPGTGKTHLVCAVGHELIRLDHSVFFTDVCELVERLLMAKRDLRLTRELRRLDRFECLILDDIGYVQQGREEMEVLFTLLSERYERRSVMITSNSVFSKWDQIFKDPMTTAAAIDRGGPSFGHPGTQCAELPGLKPPSGHGGAKSTTPRQSQSTIRRAPGQRPRPSDQMISWYTQGDQTKWTAKPAACPVRLPRRSITRPEQTETFNCH